MRHTVATGIALCLLAATATASDSLLGGKARDFELRDSDGQRVKLSTLLREGPVLLDFWATWCAPCKIAMPRWAELAERYAEHGFRLLPISQDDPRSQAKIVPYLRSQGFRFASLLDGEKRVSRLYHAMTLPTSILIAPSGEIVAYHSGYREGDEHHIEAQLRELLELPPLSPTGAPTP